MIKKSSAALEENMRHQDCSCWYKCSEVLVPSLKNLLVSWLWKCDFWCLWCPGFDCSVQKCVCEIRVFLGHSLCRVLQFVLVLFNSGLGTMVFNFTVCQAMMHASTCMECGFPSMWSDSVFTVVGAKGCIRKYYALKSVNKLPSRIYKFWAGMLFLVKKGHESHSSQQDLMVISQNRAVNKRLSSSTV